MKSGLYSIILRNSFNSTKLHETFNYDFRININENIIIKKFQIKFNNENINELRLISEEIEEETTEIEILSNNTNSSPGYQFNLYNMVIIIVFVTVSIIVIIIIICLCILAGYFCRKYKNN
jgi:hypothetical protein